MKRKLTRLLGAVAVISGVIYIPSSSQGARAVLGAFVYGWVDSMVYWYMGESEENECDD